MTWRGWAVACKVYHTSPTTIVAGNDHMQHFLKPLNHRHWCNKTDTPIDPCLCPTRLPSIPHLQPSLLFSSKTFSKNGPFRFASSLPFQEILPRGQGPSRSAECYE